MLFFDTYALIEIISGNENYKPYLDKKVITTKLNLMELYYFLLREKSKEKAEYYYIFYLPACAPVTDDIIKAAMQFKLEYRKRDLSYTDSLGYVIAKDLGIKFLTGDEQFRSLPNVEFVK